MLKLEWSGRGAARYGLLTLTSLFCIGSCGSSGSADTAAVDSSYSFEDGLDGWTPRAMDIIVGAEVIEWSIRSSQERSTSGDSSAKIHVDNRTDAAKVWLQREFVLAPETVYDVDISFDFGTSDFGDFNLWTIIAGAVNRQPNSADVLPYTDDFTGGALLDSEQHWLSKHYSMQAATNKRGSLFICVGVWGTWETLRDYYVDKLRIRISPVEP